MGTICYLFNNLYNFKSIGTIRFFNIFKVKYVVWVFIFKVNGYNKLFGCAYLGSKGKIRCLVVSLYLLLLHCCFTSTVNI